MRRLIAAFALTGLVSLAACQNAEEAPAAETPTETTAAEADAAVMPSDAPPQEEGPAEVLGEADRTCTDAIGAAAATRLAERCTMVSPATHPPCNPDNACALIQDEIDRACGQYGPGETKPAECAA